MGQFIFIVHSRLQSMQKSVRSSQDGYPGSFHLLVISPPSPLPPTPPFPTPPFIPEASPIPPRQSEVRRLRGLEARCGKHLGDCWEGFLEASGKLLGGRQCQNYVWILFKIPSLTLHVCSRELPGGSWEEGNVKIMCKSF